MKWDSEKLNLENLILKEHKSYESIGRMYNCSGANIKKVAKLLEIPLNLRRKVNEGETFNRKPLKYCLNCGKELTYKLKTYKFCSHKCSAEYKSKVSYQKLLDGDHRIMRANYSPKKFKNIILLELNYKCAICGCKPEHNGKSLVFILDHIDGHASNNIRSNLRLICPNCDSQLDTYKSKNKNGDRYYYRYRFSGKDNKKE